MSDYGRIDGQALDRHITGNYGEDSVHEEEEDDICPKCNNQMRWEECSQCGGDGVNGHDCGEDTCVCANPQENAGCVQCWGNGGSYICGNCKANEQDKTISEATL